MNRYYTPREKEENEDTGLNMFIALTGFFGVITLIGGSVLLSISMYEDKN